VRETKLQIPTSNLQRNFKIPTFNHTPWRDELRESHSDPPHPGSNESCLILLILSNHPTPKRDFNAETPESAKARESKHPSALNLRSAAFTPLHHRLPANRRILFRDLPTPAPRYVLLIEPWIFSEAWTLNLGGFRNVPHATWRDEFHESHSGMPGTESCSILLILSNHPAPIGIFPAKGRRPRRTGGTSSTSPIRVPHHESRPSPIQRTLHSQSRLGHDVRVDLVVATSLPEAESSFGCFAQPAVFTRI
jgi:hypothetical protein